MSARSRDELFIERMRWPEVRDAIADGYDRALIACGAIEQHGPHLPLLVDSLHADALALRVAERLGRTLVAPTVRVGCSSHHLAFAGTISLQEATLKALLGDYVASLAQHDFRAILVFSTHGGNFGALGRMREWLDELAGPACRVVALSDLDSFLGVWRTTVERETGRSDRVGGHADVAETSLMLALAPELVETSLAAPGFIGPVDRAHRDRMFHEGFQAVSPNGVIGDPRGMSRHLGERLLDQMADLLAATLDQALSDDRRRTHGSA